MSEMHEVIPEGIELFKRPGRKIKMALDKEYKKLNRKLPYVELEENKEDISDEDDERNYIEEY